MGETFTETEHGAADNGPEAPDHSTVRSSAMATAKRNTSPAFQFYPKDFLSSSKVQRMSLTERGIYICLLAHAWLDNGLPDDVAFLARVIGMKPSQFARVWASSPLRECFIEKNGRLTNPRLEEERKKQADYRRRQTDNVTRRWDKQRAGGNTTVLPESDAVVAAGNTLLSSSSSSSAISNLHKKKEESAEPLRDSTPAVIEFQTVGPVQAWALTQGRIDGWAHDTYPNLDVLAECRKAAAWLGANPGRRKTARGMPNFLVGWLNRAADRGGRLMPFAATGTEGRGRTGAPPAGKYDGIEESD